MNQNRMKIIGITGNSGSGKTTITHLLTKEGGYPIFCDEIAHHVLEKDTSCYKEVVAFFGVDILDEKKQIIRKKLGRIVFYDKGKLEYLTQITHRYIIEIVLKQIDEIVSVPSSYKYIIVDAPVLVGTKLMDIVDEIWVVYAQKEVLLQRIVARDGISLEEAAARLHKQQSLDALLAVADVCIDTTSQTPEQIQLKIIDRLHQAEG